MSGSTSGSPQAYVYDAVRTPRGKGKKGALHGVKPVTLTAGVLNALADRNNLDTSGVVTSSSAVSRPSTSRARTSPARP